MTTTEVKQQIENTFYYLSHHNPVTIEEREYKVWEYFMNKYGDDRGVDRVLSNPLTEFPALFIIENGSFIGSANYVRNIVNININKMMKFLETDFLTCYKKETKFIERNVKTKKDAINWIVCHEFAHTLRFDKVNHTNSFFQTVEDLFKTL